VIRMPLTGNESGASRFQNGIGGQTRSSPLQMLWTVIRLRHQLLWARARTSTGRRALFIAGYVVGVSLLLLLSLGGSAAALLSTLQGRGEETARWIFTGLWVNGATVSLLLGRGARPASLDAMLRRYPLTRMGRRCAQHLSGLLDPIWLFLSAVAVGLAAGFAVTGSGRIILSLPVVLLFVWICYLSSLVLISVVDLILSRRGGGTIMGATAFVLFAGTGLLAASVADPANASWWRGADLALRFLPPGAAASLLMGIQSPSDLLDGVTLLLWCGFLAAALAVTGRCAFSDRPVTSISDSVGSLCDNIAGLFGSSLGPLVGKALRYHIRCDRVRFSFAGTASLVLLLPRFMGRGGGPYRAFLETTALMFLAAILATASITLNQFGYDGDGVRRYWILPMPVVSALRAASIASLLLGGALVLIAIAGLPLLAEFPLGVRVVTILASSAAAGLLLFNAIGLWTSVLSPRKSSFRSVMGNELSFSSTLVIVFGIALVLAAAFVAEDLVPPARFLDWWWGFALLPMLSASLYLFSYRSISRIITARRELLTRAVSGADHP